MVKIFHTTCNARLSAIAFSEFLNRLPEPIQHRIRRFKKWQDAQASLFGKLLLKQAIEQTGSCLSLLDLKYSEFNRPSIAGFFDFNISHSGPHVACAISENRIGIDLEQVRQVQIADFRDVFHNREWDEITGSPNPYQTFFHFWTAKEALVKAEGSGLNIPLNSILIKNGISDLPDKTWFYKEIPLFEGSITHLACDIIIADVYTVEVGF